METYEKRLTKAIIGTMHMNNRSFTSNASIVALLKVMESSLQ